MRNAAGAYLCILGVALSVSVLGIMGAIPGVFACVAQMVCVWGTCAIHDQELLFRREELKARLEENRDYLRIAERKDG